MTKKADLTSSDVQASILSQVTDLYSPTVINNMKNVLSHITNSFLRFYSVESSMMLYT